MKRNLFIHQIYYTKETQSKLDRGFIPLDNIENKRPDWREYWCIKNFFTKNNIINDDFYGFFSPKLFERTGLLSDDIYDFINQNEENIDIFLFNPIKKSSFVFFNVIDQATDKHDSKTFDIFKKIFFIISKNKLNVFNLVNHSNSTVYCNYFVAKGSFWKKWLEINNFLFNDLELQQSIFRDDLTKKVNYANTKVELKVFIMERVTSIILACIPDIKRSSYNIFNMPNFKDTNFFSKKFFLFLDYLKKTYEKNNNKIYKILFFLARINIFHFSMFISHIFRKRSN
jgi:hypothetical protein